MRDPTAPSLVTTDTNIPSRQVLGETPARALKFLSALSTAPSLQAALGTRGYTDTDHQEGWDLLLRVAGYRRHSGATALAIPVNSAVREAIAAVDAWDEPNFRVARATLERRHPAQAAFILQGLAPGTGAAAVLSVTTFLNRLDALEKSKDRAKTRKEDHAALATLTRRGITPAERQRMRGLLELAQGGGAYAPTAAPGRAPATEEPQETGQVQLYAWFREWSEVARAVFQRRDHLILLGLARRKAPKNARTQDALPKTA